jgi:hypothetical protein
MKRPLLNGRKFLVGGFSPAGRAEGESMIYLAAIYVLAAVIQTAFVIWRDITETKRRKLQQELSRQYSERAEAAEERMLTATEGMREEIAALRGQR